MSNITLFEDTAHLPAYLQNTDTSNDDLTAHASLTFPVLSIKGKVFTIVRGAERQVVPNPKDPDSPATRLPIIIVKANKNKSKTFYAEAFKEGAEDVKPTCFSNDGIRPDASVEHPQCSNCANCKWNMFGTARGDNGSGKGKACSDSVRVAVVPVDGPFTEAYMLRVPPASIKNLGEFGTFLAKRKLPHQAVACELSFDQAQATPRLQFKPVGVVNEATYKQVVELSKSDEVQMIIGTANHEVIEQAEPAKAAEMPPADSMEKAADDLIKTVLEPEKKMPKTKETSGSLEDALDSIGFDD